MLAAPILIIIGIWLYLEHRAFGNYKASILTPHLEAMEAAIAEQKRQFERKGD